ncbi:hypothetical protein [Dyella nitratireducens]|nr:hypothetical protein [Dyella nitratireducens]
MMKINCERHEDLELKALYDKGMDVSWVGETITFVDGTRTFVFRLDDSMPAEAMLWRIIVEGRPRAVKLGKAFADNEIELLRSDPLLIEAVEYLRDKRQVRQIAVYDGPMGFYARVPVIDIISAPR